MKLIHIALASLALLGTAKADTICNDCEYVYYGRYLGAHWAGDRSTFGNRDIVANLTALGVGGQSRGFDDYWIFDLTSNAVVSLTVDSKGTVTGNPIAPTSYAVEIYHDTGSVCDATRCTISHPDFYSPILSKETARRWTGTTVTLPPGRYAIRIAGGTRASGESAYTGTLRAK
jgi:hypothetical protein